MYRSAFLALLACAAAVAAPPNASVSRLPLRFEENRGQASPQALFLARASGYSLELTAHGPVMALGARRVDLQLVNSNASPAVAGEQRMPAATNYLVGARDQWRTGIANYGKVRYHSVYPGIDAVYYGNQSQLEYDFLVAPGANPNAIRLRFAGADSVRLTPEGDLRVEANGQPVLQKKPRVYQDGREIASSYILHGRNEVSFKLGAYDHSRQLVIDPILLYLTYLGTSGTDKVIAMKMGPKGKLYLTGSASTGEFQYIDGAYNNLSSGFTDIFIAVIDTDNPDYPFTYFSYFGGGNNDVPTAMAVDGQGVVYITGNTSSTNFPLAGINVNSTGAATTTDAFVTKLDPSQWGQDGLLYSTYLGGTDGNDSGNAIAVDGAGKICVVGTTKSTDFPVTTSAYAAVMYGSQDAFITKIDPDSDTPLVYSTYMGGELIDDGRAVAVGPSGLIYFAASTTSFQFPIEGPGYRANLQGAIDIVLGVIDPDRFGSESMRYSTYLGGSSVDEVRAIALNSDGNLVLTGYTLSTDFPTTLGALSRAPLGNADVFVTIVNPLDPPRFMVYSTYYGGSQGDVAYDVLPTADGSLYLTGYTLSPDLFTVGAPQPGWGGGTNVFISQIKPGTPGRAGVLFSTYVGQKGQYVGNAVTLGPDGRIYAAGYGTIGLPSSSTGNAQSFFAGYDGFLAIMQ